MLVAKSAQPGLGRRMPRATALSNSTWPQREQLIGITGKTCLVISAGRRCGGNSKMISRILQSVLWQQVQWTVFRSLSQADTVLR
jgi:hypothetical protein